jgi:hypothetical protein
MFAPWLARHYPGVTMEQLAKGYWSMSGYVAMADYIKE